MSLVTTQTTFTRAVADLIIYAHALGYKLTFGDAYRDPRATFPYGKGEKSFHAKRLAIDFNVFDSDGKYLTKTYDLLPLGTFWESIGGTWGGRWDDGGHFSWGEGSAKNLKNTNGRYPA